MGSDPTPGETTIVPDASVVAKLLFPERGSSAARHALDAADALAAPDLLFAEVANTVRTKVRRGDASAAAAADLATAVASLPVEALPLSGLTADALALALALDHPVYDCYYVATAIARDAVLVTADRRLHALATRVGFGERVRLIETD